VKYESKMNIAWGITGSGTGLRKTFEQMLFVKQSLNLKVTSFITKAGMEVIRIYGLSDLLKKISPGNYCEEIITEKMAGSSCVFCGRFSTGRYLTLVVSPATSNTVAKIVHGISDTCVTTAVAQALKAEVPVIIFPCDLSTETEIPCMIDRTLCDGCRKCIQSCPVDAISIVDGKARIDLMECVGCQVCVSICPRNAITCWKRIKIRPREIDLENIDRLRKMKNIIVISDPSEILPKVRKLVKLT